MGVPIRFAHTADGLSLAYTREGAGRPLVFVRGWITHLELNREDDRFERFMTALARHVELVRYDGRGNGLSDPLPRDRVTLDDLVDDIEAIVDALDVDGVTVWGSSFGGPAAVAYAGRHPERVSALILDGTYANGGRLGGPEQRQRFLSMLELARVQPEGVFAALSYMTDPEPGTGHDARIARLRRSISADAVVALYSALYEFDVDDVLPALDVPTLVLHRRGSRAVPFHRGRELAAAIPRARFVGLDGRAHNPWEDDPAPVLGAIAEHLDLPALAEELDEPVGVDSAVPVAVLFTDLVGSTRLTRQLGDTLALAHLQRHDDTVRAALAATRGREVKHTGDGIMASFPAVSAALACAARIQQELHRTNKDHAGEPVIVRIGINAGEPLSADDDLFGTVVQLAARVCAQAEGGDVLVTNPVRDLAAGKGFTFAHRGAVELKGFDEPTSLWELHWRD